MKTRVSFKTPHLLFAAVLLARLVTLYRLTASSWLLPSGGDMHFYDAWAQSIARGEVGPAHAFYGLPGYAYLLAGIYRLVGYGPFVPAFLQAVADAATSVLIFQMVRLILEDFLPTPEDRLPEGLWRAIATHGREIAATAAGLGWLFFVPAQAYAVILMPTAWAVFVFWFVVWRLTQNQQKGHPGFLSCLFLGLLLGLTATAVATVLILIPLVVAAVWQRTRLHRSVFAGCVSLLLFGVAAGTSPCWIHNYFIARDPVFLSAHSGINFWIGNNPEANGYPRFPPGLRAGQTAMLQDSIDVAERAQGRPLRRGEVSAFWSAKAKDYIRHDFADWLRLELVKGRNLISAFQYDDLSIVTPLRQQGIVFPGIYFGLVAALGLPGIFLGWRSSAARCVAAAIFVQVLALLPVFVTERYRLPIVPGLLVFAGVGLALTWQDFVSGRGKVGSAFLIGLTIAIALVSWPQRNPSLWALDAYNTGRQALESNDLNVAEQKLLLALAYVPDNVEANFALGNLRLAQGNGVRAAACYERVLSLDPQHEGAWNNLGVIALKQNDLTRAKSCFEQVLSRNPLNAKAHFLLAKTALAAGDFPSAQREIAEALKIAPNQSEFQVFRQELQQRPFTP